MQFFTTVLALLSATPLLANAAAVDLRPRQAGGLSSIAPLPSDKAFKNTVLARVNKYRAQHGAVPYVWNQAQADFSLVQSNKCAMKHSGGQYSENIYWISSNALNFTKATNDAIDAWMSEQPLYTPANPYPALHYTALMWKKSQRIGCAWTATNCKNTNQGFYFFCEMDPQGNVLGWFKDNVQ